MTGGPSVRAKVAAWATDVVAQPRLLLAAKTAFGASLAWLLAPHLPFTDAHYSYYAPLGVVVSMYPTLISSVRTGLQALLGLAVGVGLAFGVIALDGPRVVGVALVVGVGVLVAGLRFLGEGRSWVPITALFVLLVGGSQADKYSVNYLVHMLFGVLVGVLVNVLIAPPLYLRRASARLDGLRDQVADHLTEIAAWLRDDAGGDHDWSSALDRLNDTARQVRSAVQQADESRRGNPRGRRAGGTIDLDYRRLRALERVLFFVRDLNEVLAVTRPLSDGDSPVPQTMTRELPRALDSVAALVDAPVQGDDSPARLAEAERALAELEHALDAQADSASAVADDLASTVALRHIIDAARPFVA